MGAVYKGSTPSAVDQKIGEAIAQDELDDRLLITNQITLGNTDQAPNSDVVAQAFESAATDLTDGLALKEDKANKAQPSGYASLDLAGLVPPEQSRVVAIQGFGGSVNLLSDNIPEGESNLYFTNERAKSAAVDDNISSSVHDKAPSEAAVQTALDGKLNTTDTTDIITEGSTNLYFTDTRARDAVIENLIDQNTFHRAPAEATVFAALAGKLNTTDTTDSVTEGNNNLYFTEARAQAAAVENIISSGDTGKAPSSDAVFNALALKEDKANKAVANGYASLDSGGKVPTSQLPAAVLGDVQYQSTWNATTNSPALSNGSGSKGQYYVVSVAGSVTIDGINDWKVGDWIIFNGTIWQKVDNTDQVTSVNGFQGIIVLTTDNVGEGVTNLYFTPTRAKSAVVDNFISGSVTDKAPSEAAVSTALAGKLNTTDTTDVITEGTNNLYFTVTRARTAVVDDSISGSIHDKAPSEAAVSTALAGKLSTSATTDQVAEGSNLYFTDLRAQTAAVENAINSGTTNKAPSEDAVFSALANKVSTSQVGASNGVASLDNSGLVPASQSRVQSVAGKSGIVTLSTSDVSEGSNLYYTDVRADARITAQKGLANGLASLDSGGKVPTSQLPNVGGYVVSATKASANSITALAGISVTANPRQLQFIKGSGGAVVVTATPQVAAGSTLGQELVLIGTDNTNTVTLATGNGLLLSASWVGKSGSALSLFWDGSLWSEVSRNAI